MKLKQNIMNTLITILCKTFREQREIVQETLKSSTEFCVDYQTLKDDTTNFIETYKPLLFMFVFGYIVRMMVVEFFKKHHDIHMVNYNGKCFAIFGNVDKYRKELEQMGGLYNSNLVYNNIKMAGMIFPRQKFTQLSQYMNNI